MKLPATITVDGHTIHLQQALDLYLDVLEGRAVLVHADPDQRNLCHVTGRDGDLGDRPRVVKGSMDRELVGAQAHWVFHHWGRASLEDR